MNFPLSVPSSREKIFRKSLHSRCAACCTDARDDSCTFSGRRENFRRKNLATSFSLESHPSDCCAKKFKGRRRYQSSNKKYDYNVAKATLLQKTYTIAFLLKIILPRRTSNFAHQSKEENIRDGNKKKENRDDTWEQSRDEKSLRQINYFAY